MKILSGLLMVLVLQQNLMAQSSNLGTAGSVFLKIPGSVRSAAWSHAGVALSTGADAQFINPAGLATLTRGSVYAAHTSWWEGISINHLAAGWSLGSWGVVGVSAVHLGMDDMEITTELAQTGTGQTFTASDVMVGVTWARWLSEQFAVGLSGKLIHQSIWNESATGFAIDAGTRYHLGFRDMVLAMSIRNFGTDMQLSGSRESVPGRPDPSSYPGSRQIEEWETGTYPLPLQFQVGLSAQAFKTDEFTVDLAAAVNNSSDQDEQVSTSTEITILNLIALRGSWIFNDPDRSFALGGGLVTTYFGLGLRVDYAWIHHTRLDGINRFSVALEF